MLSHTYIITCSSVKISAFITPICANDQKYDPISPIIFIEDLQREIFAKLLRKSTLNKKLKQISATFGYYSKYFKDCSLTWAAAYQRSYLSVTQDVTGGGGKSIGIDVFRLPLSLFCLRFTGDGGLQILSSSGSNGRNVPSEALCKNKHSLKVSM